MQPPHGQALQYGTARWPRRRSWCCAPPWAQARRIHLHSLKAPVRYPTPSRGNTPDQHTKWPTSSHNASATHAPKGSVRKTDVSRRAFAHSSVVSSPPQKPATLPQQLLSTANWSAPLTAQLAVAQCIATRAPAARHAQPVSSPLLPDHDLRVQSRILPCRL